MDDKHDFNLLQSGNVTSLVKGAETCGDDDDDFNMPLVGCERAAEHLARVILFFSSVDDRRLLTVGEIQARMQQNRHFNDIHTGNDKAIQRRIYRDARQAMATSLCLGLDMKVERRGRFMAFKWDGPSLKLVG